MLALAQKEHGALAWRDLFGDAERLATDGFVVSPRLAGMIGLTLVPQTPEEFRAFIAKDAIRWANVVKKAGLEATK